MICPRCGEDTFVVYSSSSSKPDCEGKIKVIQHRKCTRKECQYTGGGKDKTSYDKWICEVDPQDYLSN